ncbi:MAG: fumarylacetoacetate hydrolase family protein [Paracoccaceae bacterium]
MKLLRLGAPGSERPAILDADGRPRDLSGHVQDIAGAALSPQGLERLAKLPPSTLPELPAQRRPGPCVGGVGKLICVGLNYTAHADELGMGRPSEPVLFAKATSALSGAFDPIVRPRDGEALDYEVELAVVIGTRGRYIHRAQALSHVAGLATFNDVSERRFQTERGGQWIKGKSHDGFGPLGPWLVTLDEIDDVQALGLSLDVNGARRQSGTTARMIFPVDEIVAYVSRFMTLHPGDVIATGTPPGVAMGMRPPAWLLPGDVVEAEVDGLGRQRTPVVAWDEA